ncbi:MAG: segregation/condensation protein A, partial [Oscillospiraceae bacterium]
AQIRLMQNENMDVASEFLEMAARLVHIKSVSLLPTPEEEEALKRELTGQLLEYRQCKIIAAKLGAMVCFDSLVKAPAAIPADFVYKRSHAAIELVKHYLSAVGRGKRFLPPSPEKFSGIVSRRVVSVASQIVYVLRKLWKKGESSYQSLFSGKTERSECVATFLAVLELVKSKRLRVEGSDEDEKVILISGGVSSGKRTNHRRL